MSQGWTNVQWLIHCYVQNDFCYVTIFHEKQKVWKFNKEGIIIQYLIVEFKSNMFVTLCIENFFTAN